MSETKLILVGGGVRSGKSVFALELARQLGTSRTFVATAEPGDAEMRERISRHRALRGDDFVTVEAPLDLRGALRELVNTDVVVIDCLTLWLSNQLVRGAGEQKVLDKVEALIETLEYSLFHTVIVTNEVGMGIVPDSPLVRLFRDVAGQAHQRLSTRAQQVYFAALGMMLRLRPGPVQVANFPFR